MTNVVELRIVTTAVTLDADPALTVYKVSVQTDKSEWRETFATERELHAFMRGILCADGMGSCRFAISHVTTTIVERGSR